MPDTETEYSQEFDFGKTALITNNNKLSFSYKRKFLHQIMFPTNSETAQTRTRMSTQEITGKE